MTNIDRITNTLDSEGLKKIHINKKIGGYEIGINNIVYNRAFFSF